MKGAALAVATRRPRGLCHGLEESLRAAAPSDVDAILGLGRSRSISAGFGRASWRRRICAIAALRSVARPSLPPPPSSIEPPATKATAHAVRRRRARHQPTIVAPGRDGHDQISCSSASGKIGQARAQRSGRLTAQRRRAAIKVRQLRLDLAEALRLIGPAGGPGKKRAGRGDSPGSKAAAASLGAMGERLEEES